MKRKKKRTYQGPAQIGLGVEVHDEHVGGLHHLLLHAGRGDEDMIAVADGDAPAGARDPAQSIEAATEGADVVGRVQRVGGLDERFITAILFLHRSPVVRRAGALGRGSHRR
nr:hypothetical protein CFP56_66148 [Quercus suber]